MASDTTGVFLLYMGGPRTLDEVRPFLLELFSDRDLIRLPGGRVLQGLLARLISRLRAAKVRERYAAIGGGSPLGRITARQGELLEQALSRHGDFRVEVVMRYGPPRAREAVARMAAHGVTRCIALPLYPQFSRATSGSSLADLARAMDEADARWPVSRIESFHEHPLYLDALAAKVAEALRPAEASGPVCVVFSAHSLPQRMVDEGDPYEEQVRATVSGLVQRLGLTRWHLGFQSRSGPVKWLEPELSRLMAELQRRGERRFLIVPVSFVSDHLETLHEIDLVLRAQCQDRGAELCLRSPSLGDDPRFVEALCQLVLISCESLPSS